MAGRRVTPGVSSTLEPPCAVFLAGDVAVWQLKAVSPATGRPPCLLLELLLLLLLLWLTAWGTRTPLCPTL
jgi:hypothetical protein